MTKVSRKTIDQYITEQRQWIEEHGGDLAGYVARYGSRDDANHYGDGGEAIYQADIDALADFERRKAAGRKYL